LLAAFLAALFALVSLARSLIILATARCLFTAALFTTTLIALTIVCHNPPLFDSEFVSLGAIIQDIVATILIISKENAIRVDHASC
jgi:hypothetical protein